MSTGVELHGGARRHDEPEKKEEGKEVPEHRELTRISTEGSGTTEEVGVERIERWSLVGREEEDVGSRCLRPYQHAQLDREIEESEAELLAA